jgi:3-methylcrotonyl-CoA carboxylase beta subunit
MCGKAYDPRLIVGWPSAEIAVMGGAQASKVLLQIEESRYKADGKELDEEKRKELLASIQKKYEDHTSPYYAASQLWIDAIIDPLETRNWISRGIEMSNHAPITEPFNAGVIQT